MNKGASALLEHLLEHILQSIDLIESYTAGRTEHDFLASVELQDRVIRRVEIIGKAVKNLPENLRADHPEIMWREIAGMRDVLVHRYFEVDLELTWQVVQRDIPLLKSVILRLKEDLGQYIAVPARRADLGEVKKVGVQGG